MGSSSIPWPVQIGAVPVAQPAAVPERSVGTTLAVLLVAGVAAVASYWPPAGAG